MLTNSSSSLCTCSASGPQAEVVHAYLKNSVNPAELPNLPGSEPVICDTKAALLCHTIAVQRRTVHGRRAPPTAAALGRRRYSAGDTRPCLPASAHPPGP